MVAETATLRAAIDARGAKDGAVQFESATNKMGAAADKADGKIRKVEGGLGRIGTVARGLIPLLGGVSGALVLRNAVNNIREFEASMTLVGGISGATEAELRVLNNTARELGATTRFSATDAADGFLFLSRAGQTVDQQLKSLKPTMDLATIGGQGLGEAADLMTNVLGQFALEADQAARVVDALVATSNRANTSVPQLGQALSFAGATAGRLFNIPLETTTSLLGKLGDAGIHATRAGTGLSTVLLSLANPTKQGEDAIKALGLELDDVNPAVTEATEVFENLQRGLENAGDEGAKLFGDIFGRRGIRIAAVLAGMSDGTKTLVDEVKNASGETAGLVDDLNNTLDGSFRQLRSAYEELLLATGDAGLKGALREVVDVGTEVLRISSGLDGAWEEASVSAKVLATALRLVTEWGAVLIGLNLGVAFFSLAKGIGASTLATKGLTAAFAANPIGLAAVAIVGLIELYRLVEDVTVQWGDSTVTVGDIIKGTMDFVVGAVKGGFKLIGLALKLGADLIDAALRGKFGGAVEFVVDGVRKFATGVPKAYKAVTNATIALGLSVRDVFKGMGRGFDDFLRGVRLGVAAIQELADGNVVAAAAASSQASLAFSSSKRKFDVETVSKQISANFDRDFVGEANDVRKKFFESVQNAKQKGLLDEDIATLFEAISDPLAGIQNKAVERANQRAAARERAAEAAREEQAILERTQKAQADLNNFVEQGTEGRTDAAEAAQAEANAAAAAGEATKKAAAVYTSSGSGQNSQSVQTSPAPDSKLGGGAGEAKFFAELLGLEDFFGFASGGIFSGGRLVNQPTMFKHKGGMGVAGEAGDEIIAPATRMSDGSVGLRVQGGGGTVINQTIVAPNPAAVRRSGVHAARQITLDLNRGRRIVR